MDKIRQPANSEYFKWMDLKNKTTKKLHGVVFALTADDEYEGMTHVWVRDAENAYWFSLARSANSDAIEIIISDQISRVDDGISVTLSKNRILVKLSHSGASSLDGCLEYVINFHPESQDIVDIGEALKVIFRGKSGLLLEI